MSTFPAAPRQFGLRGDHLAELWRTVERWPANAPNRRACIDFWHAECEACLQPNNGPGVQWDNRRKHDHA